MLSIKIAGQTALHYSPMGYDLHITRKEDWSDPDGPAIEEAEWRQVIDEDPELALDTETQCSMKNGDFVFASWKGEAGLLGFYGGEIASKNPTEHLIRKMVQIADLLHANVQGDDGERYPEALKPPVQKRNRFWRRLLGGG